MSTLDCVSFLTIIKSPFIDSLVQGNYAYNMDSPYKFNPAGPGGGNGNEEGKNIPNTLVKGEPTNDVSSHNFIHSITIELIC